MSGRPRYSADTNVLIEGRKTFPPDLIGIWDSIERLIKEGRFFVCEHVMKELEYQKVDTYQWAKRQSGLVVPVNEAISNEMFAIMAAHPRLIADGKRRNAADPWVVAFAKVLGAVVVSEERPGKKDEVKIPDVCRHWNVECITLVEMARREGWKFVSPRPSPNG